MSLSFQLLAIAAVVSLAAATAMTMEDCGDTCHLQLATCGAKCQDDAACRLKCRLAAQHCAQDCLRIRNGDPTPAQCPPQLEESCTCAPGTVFQKHTIGACTVCFCEPAVVDIEDVEPVPCGPAPKCLCKSTATATFFYDKQGCALSCTCKKNEDAPANPKPETTRAPATTTKSSTRSRRRRSATKPKKNKKTKCPKYEPCRCSKNRYPKVLMDSDGCEICKCKKLKKKTM